MDTEAEMLETFEARLHLELGIVSEDFLFIHCGPVQICFQAVLLAGRSMAGKSTLVKALLDAGASYLSDEFAVIDRAGKVHPFPRPLSLRHPEVRRLPVSDYHFRGTDQSFPVGAVYSLEYSEEGFGEIREATLGMTVLKMFDNTVAAQRLGASAIDRLVSSLQGAYFYEGIRGASEVAAGLILKKMRGLFA